MKKRAKWGSVKARVYALAIGESFTVCGQRSANNVASIAARYGIYLMQENLYLPSGAASAECDFKMTRLT